MAFTPRNLPVERQRELLKGRLSELEAQRLLTGLDLAAVATLSVTDSNSQAVGQDKINLEFSVERLDAQLSQYQGALDQLPADPAPADAAE